MKFALILALALTPAFAAKKLDAVELFTKSAQKWKDMVNVGEVKDLLNPIFCVNPKTQKLALVYTQDFRYRGDGYLVSKDGNVTEINFNDLALEETDRGYFNGIHTSRVRLAGVNLFCVENAIQLESLGG